MDTSGQLPRAAKVLAHTAGIISAYVGHNRTGRRHDYPMVAASAQARRSELARSIGFGRRPAESAPAPQPEPAVPEATPAAATAPARAPTKRRSSKAVEAVPAKATSTKRRRSKGVAG